MSHRLDTLDAIRDFFQEVTVASDDDYKLPTVALRTTTNQVYVGKASMAGEARTVNVYCVARNGDLAPYPVHIPLETIESFRYADDFESPYSDFNDTNGPV